MWGLAIWGERNSAIGLCFGLVIFPHCSNDSFRPTAALRHCAEIKNFAVRPEGADHLWRKVPPRELSIALVADKRFGWVRGNGLKDGSGDIHRQSNRLQAGAGKPSRTRCNSSIKLVSSAGESEANTERNRARLASNALLMTASPFEVNRAICFRRSSRST